MINATQVRNWFVEALESFRQMPSERQSLQQLVDRLEADLNEKR